MFNPEFGINAPLKKWDVLLKNRNEVIRKNYWHYCAVSSVLYPYGKKAFFVSNVPSEITRLLSSDMVNACGAFLGEWGSFAIDYAKSTVADWENKINDTLSPARSPVCLITVQKVSDYFSRYTNYSEMDRAFYLSSREYDGKDSVVYTISGIPFSFDMSPTSGVKFANVKPLTDIGDKYVITKVETYATGESGDLPRSKVNYFPLFAWNTPSYYGVARGINNYKTYAPIGVETLFPISPSRNNGISEKIVQHRSVLSSIPDGTVSFNDTSPNFYSLLAGFTMCSDLYDTGWYGISGGTKFKSPFNCRVIVPHNNNNGDTASLGVTGNRCYVIENDGAGHFTGIFDCTTLGAGSVVFDTLDDIKEIFSDMGLTVTFSVDEAKYYPPEDLTDDIPAGYDTNNTPIVDNFPDNNTDDFEIPTNHNPAEVACATNIFSAADIKNLLDWFTTPDFYDKFSRLFNDPLSAIISLKYYPFDIVQHDLDHVSASSSTKIVNVTNANIGGYTFIDGYNSVLQGGELSYTAYYGNWADWACCKYDLYLPYHGVVSLSPSAIVNKKIKIFYNVDFISGNAQIFVKSYDSKYNKSGDNNGQLVYTTMVKISIDIPLTYTNWNEQNLYTATSALRMIGSVGNAATSGALSGATGGAGGAVAGGVTSGLSALANSAMDFVANFPRTEYGAKGDIGVGILSPQDAYLLISRRILAIPANGYGQISGNPSSFYGLIKSASGYIKATNAKCDNIPATNSEISEIMSLLAAGIYV